MNDRIDSGSGGSGDGDDDDDDRQTDQKSTTLNTYLKIPLPSYTFLACFLGYHSIFIFNHCT